MRDPTPEQAAQFSEPPKIVVVIPALDEEQSVGAVVEDIFALKLPGLNRVIVADNGSSDATAARARAAGADVVEERRRGYGAACAAALAALAPDTEIVVFMDADGADDPGDMAGLLAPILAGRADLAIGSRLRGRVERGALTLPQRFGNALAAFLIKRIWGVAFTDLGPFRAIRRDTLSMLAMADRDFGWTVEMQVKSARLGVRSVECPVSYRRRVGRSKISGTVRGVVLAGSKILYVIAREAFSGRRAAATLPDAGEGGLVYADQTAPLRSAIAIECVRAARRSMTIRAEWWNPGGTQRLLRFRPRR